MDKTMPRFLTNAQVNALTAQGSPKRASKKAKKPIVDSVSGCYLDDAQEEQTIHMIREKVRRNGSIKQIPIDHF